LPRASIPSYEFSYFRGTNSSRTDGRTTSRIKNSLSSMCLRKLSLPEGSETDDIWERVIVPSIQMKYINIKGNMNNDLKKIYLSMMIIVKCDLKNVFY